MKKIKLIAEADYRAKILYLSFEKGSQIKTVADVKAMKMEWLALLSSWPSPYKALIDCGQLLFKPEGPEVLAELQKLHDLLKKFFLRKAAAYALKQENKNGDFSFEVYPSQEEAVAALGIRDFSKRKSDKNDLRSLIYFDNHFKEHLVELSFTSEVHLKSSKDLKVLKSKLLNNLMLWHSSWKLLVDCSKLQIDASLFEEFALLEKFLKGFFLKEIVGYSPYSRESVYPFPLVRSRHKAILKFEGLSTEEGSLANCASRKKK